MIVYSENLHNMKLLYCWQHFLAPEICLAVLQKPVPEFFSNFQISMQIFTGNSHTGQNQLFCIKQGMSSTK